MQFDVEVIYLDLVYLELLGNLTHSRHPVGYVCHMCGPNTLVSSFEPITSLIPRVSPPRKASLCTLSLEASWTWVSKDYSFFTGRFRTYVGWKIKYFLSTHYLHTVFLFP